MNIVSRLRAFNKQMDAHFFFTEPMKTMEAVCNDVLAAYTAIWQIEARAIEWMTNESAEFVESLQMVEDINQIQQNVIMLDVGGCIHHLSKQSVTQHRDSFFGALFSTAFNPEEQACTFIDRDGDMFCLVATYLRHGVHLCDDRVKNQVTRECAFYCLSQPPTIPPHIVWIEFGDHSMHSMSYTHDMLHFTTHTGESHHTSVALPRVQFDGLWKHTTFRIVCNKVATYIVYEQMIMEYAYATATWIEHRTHPIDIYRVSATSTAILACDWHDSLYVMDLHGQWTWDKICQKNVYGICELNDTFFIIADDAIFTYNAQFRQFQRMCTMPIRYKSRIYSMFATNTTLYLQTMDGVIMYNLKNAEWKTTSLQAKLARCHFIELYGEFHTVQQGKHCKCPIMPDGSLESFTQASDRDCQRMHSVGIRHA